MSTDEHGDANDEQPLLELIDALDDVDENSPDAEANGTSMNDGNGGRIELTGESEDVHFS